jgi:hypothetical protein
LEHGYSQAKADLVWDAIALHSSIGIVEYKQPEVVLTSAEVSGFLCAGVAVRN